MELWSPDIIDAILWFVGIVYGVRAVDKSKRKITNKENDALWHVEDWYGNGYTTIKVIHQNYTKKGTGAYQNDRFAIEVGRVEDNDENRFEKLIELIAKAEEEAIERTQIRQIARGPRA